MKKDFVESAVVRQNVLNNKLAVEAIQKEMGLTGVLFENEYKFIFKQITDFFEVTDRTIRECIAKNEKELERNGYEVLKGKRLTDFRLAATKVPGCEVDFTTKTTVLGIFNFRAFLNIAMLLTDSEKARILRSAILDIAIDTINKRTGGGTKYINQRDEDFIVNMLRGEDYRREFTDALRDCVAMGNIKYMIYTDKIYNSIFKEDAAEYKNYIIALLFLKRINDQFEIDRIALKESLRKQYPDTPGEPLYDLDIQCEIEAVPYEQLCDSQPGESSAVIRERVLKARAIQNDRFKNSKLVHCNAMMTSKMVRQYCALDAECDKMLEFAMTKLGLSARAYDRILKVARTIADIEGSEQITKTHLLESLSYRALDRNSWLG